MKILGALLAGGQSSRFGSDKAFAMWNEKHLIDYAIEFLQNQCDEFIICGRCYQDFNFVMDRPDGQGPLGGLNAALFHANANNYDAVMSYPCDAIHNDTIQRGDKVNKDQGCREQSWFMSKPIPQFLAIQPVIGFWPVQLSQSLDQWLKDQNRRSMMAWIEYCGAKAIDTNMVIENINELSDLEKLQERLS